MTPNNFGDGLMWRKSTRSADQGGECVYIALNGPHTGIRDSKQGPDGPQLWVTRSDWTALRRTILT